MSPFRARGGDNGSRPLRIATMNYGMNIRNTLVAIPLVLAGLPGCVRVSSLPPTTVIVDVPSPTTNSVPIIPRRPKYKVVELRRDPQADYAYTFEIFSYDTGIKAIEAIKEDFRSLILKDYSSASVNSRDGSFYLDFPVFEMRESGYVKGRATVTTPVVEMTYNAISRYGTLTVHFNTAVGTDDARKWALRNIETLARDKNVLLKTGEKPTEGYYRSLGEKWTNNVLQIDFKVE